MQIVLSYHSRGLSRPLPSLGARDVPYRVYLVYKAVVRSVRDRVLSATCAVGAACLHPQRYGGVGEFVLFLIFSLHAKCARYRYSVADVRGSCVRQVSGRVQTGISRSNQLLSYSIHASRMLDRSIYNQLQTNFNRLMH